MLKRRDEDLSETSNYDSIFLSISRSFSNLSSFGSSDDDLSISTTHSDDFSISAEVDSDFDDGDAQQFLNDDDVFYSGATDKYEKLIDVFARMLGHSILDLETFSLGLFDLTGMGRNTIDDIACTAQCPRKKQNY